MILRFNKLATGLKFTKLDQTNKTPTVYTKISPTKGIDNEGFTTDVDPNEQVFKLKVVKQEKPLWSKVDG